MFSSKIKHQATNASDKIRTQIRMLFGTEMPLQFISYLHTEDIQQNVSTNGRQFALYSHHNSLIDRVLLKY